MTPEGWVRFWDFIGLLGFIAVILGCIIEGVEHFIKFQKKDEKKHRIQKFGWALLIAGLAAELIGDKLAKRITDSDNARLRLKVEELKSANVAMQLKLAEVERQRAANIPIASVMARLRFNIAGPSGVPLPSLSPLLDCIMVMQESNVVPRTLYLGSFEQLYVERPFNWTTTSAGPTTYGYSMEFTTDPFQSTYSGGNIIENNALITPEILTNRITNLRFYLKFLEAGSQVLDGQAVLIVNQTFRKTFSVPRQNVDAQGSFYATNAP